VAIFNAGALTSAQIIGVAQRRLLALRVALSGTEGIDELHQWLAGQSDVDLQALGFSASDLQALRAAVADAHALYMYYSAGLPPSTYPQPGSTYVYGASQRIVIGSQ
jgi:hypothetical protein